MGNSELGPNPNRLLRFLDTFSRDPHQIEQELRYIHYAQIDAIRGYPRALAACVALCKNNPVPPCEGDAELARRLGARPAAQWKKEREQTDRAMARRRVKFRALLDAIVQLRSEEAQCRLQNGTANAEARGG